MKVGQFSTPITPKGGSFLHADSQSGEHGRGGVETKRSMKRTVVVVIARLYVLNVLRNDREFKASWNLVWLRILGECGKVLI